MMIEVVIDMSKRKQFLEIWNIIQDFDHEIRQLGFPLSNKKTKFWVWVILIVHSLYWLLINQTGMYAFSESFLKNIGYMFLYIGTCISLIKFSGMATIIGLRFKHLNKIVGRWSPDKRRRIPESQFNAKMAVKLQDDLMLASEKLNSLCYWSLLLWLFNLCIHAVSGTYLFFQFMIHDLDHMGISVCICLIGWLLSYNIQLVILSSACHFVSTEKICFK
ncbi:uncharacterized protein LOC117180598 [Belonocnema kinseyi]|uniref:uncharacterized protein LOC117180598 n=1 Tax=Belonocnema kinseyi TaxID=2817044 RepID=UPI00143DEA7D|nr:uncharacterized protein LOC117180598 [Belonocnema kinseyi]